MADLADAEETVTPKNDHDYALGKPHPPVTHVVDGPEPSSPSTDWRENLFRAIDHTLKDAAQWDKDHDVLFGPRILGGDNTVQHALLDAVLKALKVSRD